MSKQFLIILAALVVGFFGLLFFSASDDGADAPSNAKPSSHITGKTDSKVKLVEYGDFQCPACGAYYPTVKEVKEKYADRISFQFRHLPLTSLHPNALAAARAAEAAGKQGKFFEMHDLLYENQSAWEGASQPQSYFESYANTLELNIEQYKKDFASRATNNVVNADIAAFDKTGADKATPSFFLNGKHLPLDKLVDESGSQPSVEAFSKLIDAELKKVEQ